MKQRKSYTDENVFRHLIRTFSSFLWVPKGGMKKNNSVLRKYFPQIRSSISSSDLQLQLQIGVMTFWYRKECHWLYLISALQAFCFFFFFDLPPQKILSSSSYWQQKVGCHCAYCCIFFCLLEPQTWRQHRTCCSLFICKLHLYEAKYC